MVAYSFKARFAEPIISGDKRQTIRAYRRRHARPGEELQLYTGMRTRQCRLIGHAICTDVQPVLIDVRGDAVYFPRSTDHIRDEAELNAFAVRDGFEDWEQMQAFWRKEHEGVAAFEGVLISWHQFLAG